MYKRFDDFLDQQQVKAGPPPVDLQQRQEDWLRAINDLYQAIEAILRPYTANQRISFTRSSSNIYEKQFGRYSVDRAHIELADNSSFHAELEPIGTFIIGGRGRVDMVGPTGKTVKLLLVRKDAKSPVSNISPIRSFAPPPSPPLEKSDDEVGWAWKLLTPPPEIVYLELTEDRFLDALMYVMDR